MTACSVGAAIEVSGIEERGSHLAALGTESDDDDADDADEYDDDKGGLMEEAMDEDDDADVDADADGVMHPPRHPLLDEVAGHEHNPDEL